MNREIIEKVLTRHREDGNQLISILEDIQAACNYLPEEALRMVSEQTGHSLVDVYGVATFYKAFSLKPRGKHLVSACLGTACHVRGGPIVAKELESQLGIKSGGTTPDREFTLETVACLGACALGPVVVMDGHYFPKVSRTKVKGILAQARDGIDGEIAQDYHIFPVQVSCPKCNHSLMDSNHIIEDYPSIRVTVAWDEKHGWLEMSSMYGSYKVFSEHEIPPDTVLNFFCPHCHAELVGGSRCNSCGAQMVPMIVRGGGVVQICSRRGCKNHILDLG
jgi:NADH-quinone oxidoreductase subunit E